MYSRAWELCQQMGDTLEVFPVQWGLSTCYIVQAKQQLAREVGTQLLSLPKHRSGCHVPPGGPHGYWQGICFMTESLLLPVTTGSTGVCAVRPPAAPIIPMYTLAWILVSFSRT